MPFCANIDITTSHFSQVLERLDKTGKEIHLVRSAFHRQFTETMGANGIDAVKYYRQVGLPVTEPEDPGSLLPEKPFWRLVNLVARDRNVPDFGSQIALRYPWHRVQTLAPLIGNSKNLKELLITFCQVSSSQSSQVEFDLETHDSRNWFAANGNPLIRNDIQMELYRVTCMIQLIQLATGSGWQPDRVRLSMPNTSLTKSCPLLAMSQIGFSCNQTAVAIPDIALKLPIRLEIPSTRVNLSNYNIDAGFLDSLRLILVLGITHGEFKIESIARTVDIPIRTLQRQIEAHGTSFNKLLGEVRYEIAREELLKTNLKIQEISAKLGYSDNSHFVRAFKRWSGITPRKLRESASSRLKIKK